jgi:4-amino-4-deoxy-L-arabinose transferase-like glycosyltransferase
MNFPGFKKKWMQNDLHIIIFFSLITVFIHFLSNAFIAYGIFRDEFYYIACSKHLALGYVDQPPLSIYLLYISRMLFGDSLFALRLFPSLTGGLIVFITGLVVRKLGGGRTALLIALISITVAPFMLAGCTIYSMNCFDGLFWVLAVYLLIRIIDDSKPRLWILLGVVTGLGLLNKISMAWFAIGLAIALLLTPQRKHLATKWPYLAGIIAFVGRHNRLCYFFPLHHMECNEWIRSPGIHPKRHHTQIQYTHHARFHQGTTGCPQSPYFTLMVGRTLFLFFQ